MLCVNKKNATLLYTVIQALYFFANAMVFCYASAYLLQRGLSNGQIGITMGISYVLSALLQPALAMVVERTHIRLGVLMSVLYAVFILASLALVFLPLHSASLIVIMIIVASIQSSTQASVNALHRGHIQNGITVNFSLARGVGSATYSLSNFCMGRLLLHTSILHLPTFYLAATALLIGMLLLFQGSPSAGDNPQAVTTDQKALLLKQYPYFYLFLAGLSCLSITHSFTETYLLQIIQRFGGTSADLGTVFGIAAITELPAMLLYSRVYKKLGNRHILAFAGWMWATKNFLIMIAGNIYVVYAAALLQFFSFAIYVPAAVRYISHAIPKSEFLKGHALAGSAFTVGSIFATFVGGQLIDRIGMTPTLWLLQIFSVAGVVLFTAAMFGSIRNTPYSD